MPVEPIGKIIESLMKNWGVSNQDRHIADMLMSMLEAQEKKHSQPGRLKQAVLTLYVDSPTRMYAIGFKKNLLLKKLQLKFGQENIRDIKLKVGRVG